MLDEQQPVEEVEVEEVTQPEITEETETEETETEETPAPSAELDENNQKEIARKQFQERQTRRQREDELRRENEYLRKMALGNQQPTHQPQRQSSTSHIKLEDFGTEDEWFEAKYRHLKSQEEGAVQANSYKRNYNQKLEEYAETNPDVFEYEGEVARMVSPTVADFIVNSEMTGQLIEAIALDPKKAKALNNSKTQYELGKNIIKLEESLSKKPKFSNAPPPVNQPKSDPVISGKDPSSMNKKDYAEWRNSQRK